MWAEWWSSSSKAPSKVIYYKINAKLWWYLTVCVFFVFGYNCACISLELRGYFRLGFSRDEGIDMPSFLPSPDHGLGRTHWTDDWWCVMCVYFRMVSNRLSARRSRKRRQAQQQELEMQVTCSSSNPSFMMLNWSKHCWIWVLFCRLINSMWRIVLFLSSWMKQLSSLEKPQQTIEYSSRMLKLWEPRYIYDTVKKPTSKSKLMVETSVYLKYISSWHLT